VGRRGRFEATDCDRLQSARVRELCPSHADVAQLVEHHLAKVRVAGSNPVVRSETSPGVCWSGCLRDDAGGVAEWFRQGPAKPCTRVRFPPPPRAVSSAGERLPDTEEVTGSIPVPPTSALGGPCPRKARARGHSSCWPRGDPRETPRSGTSLSQRPQPTGSYRPAGPHRPHPARETNPTHPRSDVSLSSEPATDSSRRPGNNHTGPRNQPHSLRSDVACPANPATDSYRPPAHQPHRPGKPTPRTHEGPQPVPANPTSRRQPTPAARSRSPVGQSALARLPAGVVAQSFLLAFFVPLRAVTGEFDDGGSDPVGPTT
jgi:hypothetical protein